MYTVVDIYLKNFSQVHILVTETLRKYPFAPFLLRECTEPYEFKKTGLVIDKNVPILIPIKGLHYDESVYPNPDKFDPERFSEDNKGVKYLNIAFGLGPRSCIGAVMFIQYEESFGLKIMFSLQVTDLVYWQLKWV